ncbi:IS5 family transposase [candidate division KSB1 bacterium]|nr:IS5 family transposase [candidate division KSB1 bacterium]
MAYKKIEYGFSFADIAIKAYSDKNRNLIFLRDVENTIDWQPIQGLLMKYYEPGKSKAGEKAYPPLLLFKCLLLQKWFRIKSDPELESQINDRISFKSFLQLPLDQPSPDHSTFSRFRSRLSKNAMIKINSNLLNQFHQHGLSINEGIAVDARLVKSVSHPVSQKELKELIQKAETPEGKLNKKGTKKKYSRDLDSDWTVKNEKPHFGLKEHTAVDTNNGFILSTYLTPSSQNDSIHLPMVTISSMHTKNKIQKVYADKGYAGAPNRGFLALNNIKDGIMRKDSKTAKLTETEIERNKAISKFRYIVEQYFGISHLHDNGERARFPKILKNTIDIMFRQFAFNLKKGAKILYVTPV